MTTSQARQFTLVIDYVPDQGWEAYFEGGFPTLSAGGLGWEADTPEALLSSVAKVLRVFHHDAGCSCGEADLGAPGHDPLPAVKS